MWIILLEAAVALSLLILIVWWTKPFAPRKNEHENDKDNDNDNDDAGPK
jgi:hypothetical protein